MQYEIKRNEKNYLYSFNTIGRANFFYESRRKNDKVKLNTSYGEIVIELDSENAPITTENFLSYVDSGFYDETIFHRVISNFMIQGVAITKICQQKIIS